jgi:hypothetical protein
MRRFDTYTIILKGHQIIVNENLNKVHELSIP